MSWLSATAVFLTVGLHAPPAAVPSTAAAPDGVIPGEGTSPYILDTGVEVYHTNFAGRAVKGGTARSQK
ncbi:uncharacterized protein ColSpa_09410 [Colletotrichum spaethianum]|uniref:Uncharacterized protein n=1 Tax=Colletotrichum spaethianum TaxID=700344 RepID=A0AA37UJ67_9PEZI|nr:uncharacterized protein ColSpa_09410 [Colletotrichum spaethianum]GKT49229.1 hypothetical protein ColSpa_09410 [Colletotrichum spaethianum]